MFNPLKFKIMTKDVSMYVLAAIANYSSKNQEDEVSATSKSYTDNFVYIEVSDKNMKEDGYISSTILKTMETIAESWGGWAHVEYDSSEHQLFIVLN